MSLVAMAIGEVCICVSMPGLERELWALAPVVSFVHDHSCKLKTNSQTIHCVVARTMLWHAPEEPVLVLVAMTSASLILLQR